MTFSTLGTAQDQRLVFLHEKVHQFLAPKLYFMRDLRVTGRVNSYFKSSLYRWFEEMLAETFARIRVLGFNPKQIWLGMSFPVRSRYVHLVRAGGYSQYMAGKGLATEGAALMGTITMAEFPIQIYLGGALDQPERRR